MSKRINLSIISLLISLTAISQINLRFVDAAEARKLLQIEDATTHQWSRFDYESRLGRNGATKQELIEFITEQALDWTDEDKQKLQEAASELNALINEQQLNLPLPKEVKILKTTLKEEGGAGGYTRKDYIVLESNIANYRSATMKHLLAHELFHILTRNHPAFREKLYQCIGFKISPKEFEYPADLMDLRITNPDVNRFDSYATFSIKGEKKDCGMVIYASSPYKGGVFFNYLTLKLVPIKDGKAEQKDGKTVTYSIEEAEDFFEKIGKNTGYVIDPEEALADNFADILVNRTEVPNPEVQERIRKALK